VVARLVDVSRRAELVALGRRSQQVLLLSAVTGALVGLGVALFDQVTRDLTFDSLLRTPSAVQAFGPLVGLGLAALALRYLAGGATSASSDEYIKNFHEHDRRLALRSVPGRMLAAVATLGLGGALGLEGPSIYLGASIGSVIQRRFSRLFSRDDAKLLLVAGAAAGVAAIFKAPATGAIFALEVPYQDDTARRMLLPALTGAAVSYVVFVAFAGTAPLLPVSGAAPFDLRDLGGAALIGLLCGVGARGFALVLRRAKSVATRMSAPVRVAVAGGLLAVLFAVSRLLLGAGLTLGPGYRTVEWATDPRHGIALVLSLLVLRAVATVVTVGGGGVGGLFIPLVIEGALLGRAVGGVFGNASSSLFSVVGIAAFLGAGYRTPLAGVMFVAESTGRPGFVVPALLASVVAQLVMGRSSVTPYQHAARAGHLERRFGLPITVAIQSDVLSAPPDATLAEFVSHHLLMARQKSVAVVEGRRYLGMVRSEDLAGVPREDWAHTTVKEILRDDVPVGRPDWRLREAVLAMERADIDVLAVTDDDMTFVGVVSTAEILKLDDILEQAGDE
jgi:CIC family chloride channel protein